MGIDWWEHDPSLSSRAHGTGHRTPGAGASSRDSLADENARLRAEIEQLKNAVGLPAAGAGPTRQPSEETADGTHRSGS
jgi:hypothetical protein